MAVKKIQTCDLCGELAKCATFEIPAGIGRKSWWQNFFGVEDWITTKVDICPECIEEIRARRKKRIEEEITVTIE